MAILTPPSTLAILWERAQQLVGFSIEELANKIGWSTPTKLITHKGWLGDLLEQHLGACAGSRAEPDFPHLGVELKTIPVTAKGKPLESTFVSTVPLENLVGMQWHLSEVYLKLSHILWIPILGERGSPISQRRIASPFLWQPNEEQARTLKEDWELLTDEIVLGNVTQLTAHQGTYLQVRPKGANAQQRRWGVGPEGAPIRTQPLGFYLRTSFTQNLLKNAFLFYS